MKSRNSNHRPRPAHASQTTAFRIGPPFRDTCRKCRSGVPGPGSLELREKRFRRAPALRPASFEGALGPNISRSLCEDSHVCSHRAKPSPRAHEIGKKRGGAEKKNALAQTAIKSLSGNAQCDGLRNRLAPLRIAGYEFAEIPMDGPPKFKRWRLTRLSG